MAKSTNHTVRSRTVLDDCGAPPALDPAKRDAFFERIRVMRVPGKKRNAAAQPHLRVSRGDLLTSRRGSGTCCFVVAGRRRSRGGRGVAGFARPATPLDGHRRREGFSRVLGTKTTHIDLSIFASANARAANHSAPPANRSLTLPPHPYLLTGAQPKLQEPQKRYQEAQGGPQEVAQGYGPQVPQEPALLQEAPDRRTHRGVSVAAVVGVARRPAVCRARSV